MAKPCFADGWRVYWAELLPSDLSWRWVGFLVGWSVHRVVSDGLLVLLSAVFGG